MSSSDDVETGTTSETTVGGTRIERHAETCLDGIAIKPAEMDLDRATAVPFDRVTIDYEGTEHVPSHSQLEALAEGREVRMTIPVRADGYDPLGSQGRLEQLPERLRTVLVAGHPAYLTSEERRRAVAPRFTAAMDLVEDPWVGTEGVERIALATGATQFELLSDTSERDIRALRAAGFEGTIAVYAPTVLTGEADAVLEAVGAYVSRRKPVARKLPTETPTDAAATGDARDVLLEASRKYALVGSPETVRERVDALREAGADSIVGYPARGLDEFGV